MCLAGGVVWCVWGPIDLSFLGWLRVVWSVVGSLVQVVDLSKKWRCLQLYYHSSCNAHSAPLCHYPFSRWKGAPSGFLSRQTFFPSEVRHSTGRRERSSVPCYMCGPYVSWKIHARWSIRDCGFGFDDLNTEVCRLKGCAQLNFTLGTLLYRTLAV